MIVNVILKIKRAGNPMSSNPLQNKFFVEIEMEKKLIYTTLDVSLYYPWLSLGDGEFLKKSINNKITTTITRVLKTVAGQRDEEFYSDEPFAMSCDLIRGEIYDIIMELNATSCWGITRKVRIPLLCSKLDDEQIETFTI